MGRTWSSAVKLQVDMIAGYLKGHLSERYSICKICGGWCQFENVNRFHAGGGECLNRQLHMHKMHDGDGDGSWWGDGGGANPVHPRIALQCRLSYGAPMSVLRQITLPAQLNLAGDGCRVRCNRSKLLAPTASSSTSCHCASGPVWRPADPPPPDCAYARGLA